MTGSTTPVVVLQYLIISRDQGQSQNTHYKVRNHCAGDERPGLNIQSMGLHTSRGQILPHRTGDVSRVSLSDPIVRRLPLQQQRKKMRRRSRERKSKVKEMA